MTVHKPPKAPAKRKAAVKPKAKPKAKPKPKPKPIRVAVVSNPETIGGITKDPKKSKKRKAK